MTWEEYRGACLDVAYLAGCAVNGRTPDATRVGGMDPARLYAAAERHLLASVTAAALERAGVKDDAFTQARGRAIRRIALLDADRAAVTAQLDARGIWYMPLKGAVLKDCYPHLGMREMADNDILFDDARAAEVRQVMESLGFAAKQYGVSVHDVYHKPPVSNFEMHRALFGPSHEKRLVDYYAGVKRRLVKDEGNACGFYFTPEDFYIYITAHEYKHYANGGTGMRSLLDAYVYLKRYGDALDGAYLRAELSALALTDFEARNRSLAAHLFGGEALTDAEREMLDYILASGTYGTLQHSVEHAVAKRGRLGFFIRRAFLPYRSMCALYPVLQKIPVLLPFCWAARWIHALRTKPGRVHGVIRAAMRAKKK